MAEEREALELLESQLRAVRRRTRELVARTPDEWLYRRVEWTDNTIGWHMGLLARELDAQADAAFGVGHRLGADWESLFDADAGPAAVDDYLSPERLRNGFSVTLNRFLEQLGQTEDDSVLMRRRRGGPKTLLERVLILIYHEGEHASGIAALLRWFEREAGVATASGQPTEDAPA